MEDPPVVRTHSILGMHPYDASDYLCGQLEIPREAAEKRCPTMLVFAWAPRAEALETDEIENHLKRLLDVRSWQTGVKDVAQSQRDYLSAAYWKHQDDGQHFEAYEEAVEAGRYVWDSLTFRNVTNEETRMRASIGKTPYSALCGLRMGCDSRLTIEHAEKGNREPVFS